MATSNAELIERLNQTGSHIVNSKKEACSICPSLPICRKVRSCEHVRIEPGDRTCLETLKSEEETSLYKKIKR